MSDTLATYTFLPWLRQGLSNSILQQDNDSSVKLRASIPLRLTVSPTLKNGSPGTDQPIDKTVELYGPGDISGIDAKAIVKTEPRNWITNFEPNYLPYIEFYEEDFPWRYTPARANGDRLRPWLTLVVLKEEEFSEGQNIKDKPLPFFKIKEGLKALDLFPKSSELWAWAHVHVNKDLSNGAAPNAANADTVTGNIKDLINTDPDQAYSRIVCPRKLEANMTYHAFLIPSFESGRLTGLGWDLPDTLAATACSWETEANVEFPYYHRWYFRTGNVGDFEYLVNLLKPRPADKKVGVRDMDVLHPGVNLPAINDPALVGVLKLGGALRVPFDSLKPDDKIEVKKFDEWDEHPYPHYFTTAIAKRINLADNYTDGVKSVEDLNKELGFTEENDNTKGDPDPVITSPLYGRWHALQQRLLLKSDGTNLLPNKNWIHEANLDPRFRVAAGLGTKVVQKQQETYMMAAWEQVGRIIESNNKIRWAQLATEVSAKFYDKHVLALATGKAFVFSAPVQKRIIYNGVTVHQQVFESKVPPAISSGTFRSMLRPRGRIMKSIAMPVSAGLNTLVEKINEGNVIVVPPKVDPPGAVLLSDIADKIPAPNVPPIVAGPLKKYPWFIYLPLILLLLLILIILLFFRALAGGVFLTVAAAGLIMLYNKFRQWDRELKNVEVLKQANQLPIVVDSFSHSDNFVISTPESGFNPTIGSSDNIESRSFKTALKEVFTLVSIHFTEPVKKKLDLKLITDQTIKEINPHMTIPKRTKGVVKIPKRIAENMVEVFTPVMAYPEIDTPMYKPLADMSSELFLPNINMIEQNSITLLENNQKFIESYMLGINHEMSRELLWREYPTDQRGTYFRQFWDVSSFMPPEPVPADIRERLRDIPKIHTWPVTNSAPVNPQDPNSPLINELGQHNQRASQTGSTQLVLVIRGELLKKYPTAVVYAHKADWGLKNGNRDITVERKFVDLTDAEKENPPLSKIKTPLFEAKVDPDIYFFGFDLDDEVARGNETPTSVNDASGWFFVIKERPGEPRFGLDIEKSKNEDGVERLINWNNMSWKDIETPDGKCIELNKTISFQVYDTVMDQENTVHADDVQAVWSPDSNSAELAYILYQVPVLVGVHASRMLPK